MKCSASRLTSTATRPGICVGDVQLTIPLLTKRASTTMLPKRHLRDAVLTNALPSTLTRVCPFSGPVVGVTSRMVGSSWYTKCTRPPAADTTSPSTLSRTSTRLHAPAARGGATHCTVCGAMYELTTPTCPKWQRMGPGAKSLPISVTSEPPVRGPAVGRSAASRADARY